MELPKDLPKFRLGQTLHNFGVSIETNGQHVDLEGRDLTVFLIDPHGTKRRILWSIDDELPYVIRFDYEGARQEIEGIYRVLVYENYNKPSQAVFELPAFVLLKNIPRRMFEDDIILSGGMLFIGGVSVVSIDVVSETAVSGGENVWRATRSDGLKYDLVVRNGQKGEDGNDGHTPYVQDNYWYINGQNTGVRATVGLEEIHIDDETGQAFVEI